MYLDGFSLLWDDLNEVLTHCAMIQRALRVPPAGAIILRQDKTSWWGCCPDAECWIEAFLVMAFALQHNKDQEIGSHALISTDLKSLDSPHVRPNMRPWLYHKYLLGIVPIALLSWHPAGVSQNHNYFLTIKNESQDFTGIDHSPPACKSWNQVISTSFLLTE